MLSIFSCIYWPFVYFLWRNVCLVLLPIFLSGLFVFLMLSCMSCFCILEINLLSVLFENIFFQSEGCLLILSIVFFVNLVPFVYFCFYFHYLGWGRDTNGKEPACQCRRCEFDSWVGKIPWRRHGNPLQYSCLENPMDRGTWWATVHGVAESWTQLSV